MSAYLAEINTSTRTHRSLSEEALTALLGVAEAATPGPWHWAGNTDTGEPYLATWLPGAGRCQILAVGTEERTTTERRANAIREEAVDLGADPETAEDWVNNWAFDGWGQPIKDGRLWFYTDLMADPARDRVVYEVAPKATRREDPAVYRADIIGVNHPDAEFMAAADPQTVKALITDLLQLRCEHRELQEKVARLEAATTGDSRSTQ